ncbi:MAG: GGDEF domain-containing response regulator [Proteobacteria bacterium]|nr:MAG: GGDEF domain-containing response regulator [Pseudomonadota bacterium]
MTSETVHELKAVRRPKPVVLVVDDRPTTRSLVRSVLEDGEYRVFEAADGYKALAMIESEQPDVVLLDIIMPGIDGLETLRRIRQRWDEIELPVIMLTVKDTLSDIIATLEIGATDFLSKPINFPILLARLNRHLQRKRLADQIQQMRDTLEQKVDFRTKQLAEQGHALERSLEKLKASEHRYSSFYNDTPSFFITLNEQGELRSINRYGAEYLGWNSEELTGKPVARLFHPGQAPKLASFIELLCREEDAVHRQEFLLHNRFGEHVWLRVSGRSVRQGDGELQLLLAGEDVSESYELAERLAYQSGRDELTGMVNRVELLRRLDEAVEQGARDGVDHTLCLLDIDQFRVVNDTRGHVSGDRFLCAFGRRLGSLLGPADIIARVGGDEFALFLKGMKAADARSLAERIRVAIETFRFEIDGERFGVTASVGVVPIESGASSVTEIMTQADAACYSAKQIGGNTVYLFKADDEVVERHYGEAQWASKIQTALDSDLFEFFAQEIVPANPASGQRSSLELLLRMRKNDGSYIPNSMMISAVEEFHYGLRVDSWVVEHAFRMLADHGIGEDHPHTFSINLSGQSLANSAFFNHVLDRFRHYAIAPRLVCFEVTETAAIGNLEIASQFFGAMHQLGSSLALDDFGSGLSSYGYLKQIPADVLKIDGSLINNVEDDGVKLAIVESIIRLAGKLGKKTIAEHVERSKTRDTLIELGVDMIQGNLVGEPSPLTGFLDQG